MAEAKRRLAAILSADVAGYSRLMGDDERATLATLDAYRAVFADHITKHDGRVVDMAGDSVLAVFDSVVEAVQCAVTVQEELTGRNGDLPETRRMPFRIGVNLGDVIAKSDGTIYGDGVNVAARLEALAEPGAVCVSESAYMQADGKLDVGFDDIGEHEVKNIAKPVRAYRVVASGMSSPAGSAKIEESDRPTIAVLPFENLSGDKEQEYFADGIAEDLITELSHLRWLQVTARNSTFTYKGQAVDVKQVGRDLAVRYVVEGSVRRGGDRVRITAQLIDAASGNHIWAERYDRDLTDIFALQDEITETLVAALQGEVGMFETERARRKPPDSLDAWELYQRGMWHRWRFNAEDMAEACRLFERAGELDRNFALAFAELAITLSNTLVFGYADDPIETLDHALRLATHAVSLDDKEARAHYTLGRIRTLRCEYDDAIAGLRTAIDLNPSLALAHFGLGVAFSRTDRLDEAVAEYDTAVRLSPRDPLTWMFLAYRAGAHLASGDFAAAVDDSRQAIRHPGAPFWPYATLAAALAQLGRQGEAETALDKLLSLKPDFSPETALAAFSPLDPEAVRANSKNWFDGLRKAGLDTPDPAATKDGESAI